MSHARAQRILNVNDREANRYALSRVLTAAGFDVVEAQTAAEALQQVRATNPALLVLDVELPDMSGFELARRLKSEPSTAHILILHVSAVSVQAHDRAQGLERGADGYLTEPVEPEVLIATIRSLLRLGEAEARARSAARNWRLLSDASELLLSSLDYEQTLHQVAAVTVPALADHCLIDLRQPDGSLRRVTGTPPERQQEEGAALAEPAPAAQNPSGIIEQVVASGEAALISEVGEADLARLSLGLEQHEVFLRAPPSSVICVPMVGRDRTLGAVTLLSCTKERRFSVEDRELALELARRAGLAVENARLHEEARLAIQTRDEFFSIASHELKNPLSALLLQLKLLQRELRRSTAEPATMSPKVDAAERNAARLGELVQELLDTTRIRAGKLELRREPADLGIIARDVAQRLESQALAANSPIRIRTEAEVVGEWDRSRVEQVVMNVMSNAIKYGAGEPVEVEVAKEGDGARFVVRDGGIGISPQDQDRIFEPFERGRSTGFSGLGLGLYISRKIVEAHGGRIQLQSVPSSGSTFLIHLPLR